MPFEKHNKPTESELEILQVLWNHGPSTVRFVHEEIGKTREVGYTTTLKQMQVMEEKGMLKADKTKRSHVFHPLLDEEKTQQQLLNRFLESTFRGSAMKLVMQAFGNRTTSKEELDQIRKFLDKLEGGNK